MFEEVLVPLIEMQMQGKGAGLGMKPVKMILEMVTLK